MAKALKLFKIGTAMTDSSGEEIKNWSGYTVAGHSAEEAIRKAKKLFHRSEYVESVAVVAEIDLA
jgi:hypothetical protein